MQINLSCVTDEAEFRFEGVRYYRISHNNRLGKVVVADFTHKLFHFHKDTFVLTPK